MKNITETQVRKFEELYKHILTEHVEFDNQRMLTPVELCYIMLRRKDLLRIWKNQKKNILVINNVEFILVLIVEFGVCPSRIVYVTDSEAKARYAGTFLEEENILHTNFLEWEADMKFDVVIGNPPYQSGKGERGGATSIWRKFVRLGWGLLNEKGRLVFIVPQLPNASKDLGEIFYNHQTEIVWDDINHHFPGVGSSFRAWIVCKTPKTHPTFFIDQNLYVDITSDSLPRDIEVLPLIQKILAAPKFNCRSSSNYLHTQVADGKCDDYLSSKKSKKLRYRLRRTSGATYDIWGAEEPEDYRARKVCFTYSGYPHYKYHNEKDPIGTIKFQSGHILVKNKKEGENLICLYESRLYRFVMHQLSPGGMRGKAIYELPKLDLTRTWTDEELYKHFGLTQEEIDYIEATVK